MLKLELGIIIFLLGNIYKILLILRILAYIS